MERQNEFELMYGCYYVFIANIISFVFVSYFVVDLGCVNVVAIFASSDLCLHWQV